MADETTDSQPEGAKPPEAVQQTVPEKLDGVLAKLCPASFKVFTETGKWPVRQEGDRLNDGAPYAIRLLPDGSRRVTVVSDEGDTLSGNGPTTGAAVDALVGKVGK